MNIIPAILPKKYSELEHNVAKVKEYANLVQIDICDGEYVSAKTWPYKDESHFADIIAENEGMPFWEEVEYELDLMIINPFDKIEEFLRLSPSRIVFHYKTIAQYLEEFEKITLSYVGFVEFGVAFELDDDLEDARDFIETANFVQFMGIEKIGYQGQEFSPAVFEKIKFFKKKYPEKELGIDGGIKGENILALRDAGVDSLIIGSTIFASNNPQETIVNIENLIEDVVE